MSEFGRPSRTRRPAPQYHEEAEQPTHGEGERKLRVVTAGSCQGNGTSRARMGVAYLIPDGTGRHPLDQGVREQVGGTNQQAVLLAVLDGLKSIRRNNLLSRTLATKVEVVTRNFITVNTFNVWVHRWTRRGGDEFRRPNGKVAENGDLLADILDAQEALGPQVTVSYVYKKAGTDPDETAVALRAQAQVRA
eukprot:GHVU01190913.1.p1 GENE.GHVU01190913.1~~GHVU01190913.1.p1  ORF type:complete len:192 (+),score=22.12 GHVU01190913.1:237-812(+)